MITAYEAKTRAEEKGLSDTYFLRKLCEERILDACMDHMQWCLVPPKDFRIGAKIRIYRELIHIYGYSVTQRNSEEGNCLYIKWGHKKQEDELK